MPILKNARHERFAQELATGKSLLEAHRLAGYGGDDGNATRLSQRPEVAERVRELQAAAAEAAGITIERLTAMFLEDRQKAHSLGQIGPAVTATDRIAKLHGFMVDRVSAKIDATRRTALEELSDDELEAIASRGREGTAEAAEGEVKPSRVRQLN